MVYKGGFCVDIVKNGSVIEDKNGTASLMFGSEYAIRLKNKNTRDAVAKIYIDGREVTKAGDIILHAGETTEIERYIDSVDGGNKFKFISLDDVAERDRGNPANGVIEVRYRLKKEEPDRVIYREVHEHHYHYGKPWQPRYPYYLNGTWVSNNDGSFSQNSQGCYKSFTSSPLVANSANIGNTVNCSYSADLGNNVISTTGFTVDNMSGKTVEGSKSNQKFNYSFVGELEEKETIVKLKIVGYTNGPTSNTSSFCVECGSSLIDYAKFCSNCGKKR